LKPPGSRSALPSEIEHLGGRKSLDDLGWPTFAPAFLNDTQRVLRILNGHITNKAVEKEVAELVKKSGGYQTLAADDVRDDMGLNTQLHKLREIRDALDADKVLKNEELAAMAEAYGANLKKIPTLKAKSDLLAQVRDYDKWASDARNADMAAALDGCPFKERRQAQLGQQLKGFGGDAAFAEALKAHPAGLNDKSPVETKITVLRALKEYTKLGGDAAYLQTVGNDPAATPLTTKLEQLKAVQAAAEK
jgi:hypothetical protein